MATPAVGVALMPEPGFAAAAQPLLASGEVDLIEWSFDCGWGRELPPWLPASLDHFAAAGRLLGHGVSFSPLSGAWHARQGEWLTNLTAECHDRPYRHVTEHFGFMTAGSFHKSAPLPVSMTAASVTIGRDRLARLRDACERPVGLENLAFAFGLDDVRRQGEFLDTLLEPADGLLVLDLHNLYCHLCNFDLDADRLLASYPLHRVRELHVSGGSWSEPTTGAGKIRRDTHDEAVPRELFELVSLAVRQCPNVEAVIFERLGDTIRGPSDQHQFAADFRELRRRVWETA